MIFVDFFCHTPSYLLPRYATKRSSRACGPQDSRWSTACVIRRTRALTYTTCQYLYYTIIMIMKYVVVVVVVVFVCSALIILFYIKTLVIYRSLGYTTAQCVRYDIIRCRRTADVDADSAAGSGNSSGGSRIAGYYLTYNILYYNIILLLWSDNEIIMCVLVCDASVSLARSPAQRARWWSLSQVTTKLLLFSSSPSLLLRVLCEHNMHAI